MGGCVGVTYIVVEPPLQGNNRTGFWEDGFVFDQGVRILVYKVNMIKSS